MFIDTVYSPLLIFTIKWRRRISQLTWYRDAGQRTGACVQIVQEHTKRIRIEFDDVELGLGQFGAIDLLGVGADGEAWHGQLIAARLILIFVLTVSVCQVWK